MKELRNFRLITLCIFLMTLQSCFNDNDNELTIAKGTVTDKITGEQISNIPVEILKCKNGLNIEGPQCDSLKTVFTNSEGMYETSFRTEKGYHYKIGVMYSDWYNGTDTYWHGQIIEEGKTNIFNFEQTPFKVLEVLVETIKNSKNFLHIQYTSIASNAGWLGGTILLDTSI